MKGSGERIALNTSYPGQSSGKSRAGALHPGGKGRWQRRPASGGKQAVMRKHCLDLRVVLLVMLENSNCIYIPVVTRSFGGSFLPGRVPHEER